jgi:hypothetical protein
MKRICAWCKKELESGFADEDSDGIISHGICEECSDKIFAQQGIPLSTYIETLDAPIAVVDGNGTILTANKKACTLLDKQPEEIEGFRGGDVFGCAYASLPGGCGKTIHCSGCTIRINVMDTFETGASHLKTPAYINRGDANNPTKIELLISTEKAGMVVLLRLDDAGSGFPHIA